MKEQIGIPNEEDILRKADEELQWQESDPENRRLIKLVARKLIRPIIDNLLADFRFHRIFANTREDGGASSLIFALRIYSKALKSFGRLLEMAADEFEKESNAKKEKVQ